MRPLFQMGEGDVFSTGKLRKGLEQLRKLYGEFGYIDFVPEPNFDVVPNYRQDRPDPDRRRRQAVLRAPHRFLRQHHHARQGHPPRAAARRRRYVQHAPVGDEHSPPQPARLLRAVEGRRGGRPQAQYPDQHGGHHAQGEGARQELGGAQRRRFGYRRQLHGVQLLHQQLPGVGRDAVDRFAARHAPAQRAVFLHRAVLPGPSHPDRVRSSHDPVQLRPGARDFDPYRARLPAAVQLARPGQPAQLRAERQGLFAFGELPVAPLVCARGLHLRLR